MDPAGGLLLGLELGALGLNVRELLEGRLVVALCLGHAELCVLHLRKRNSRAASAYRCECGRYGRWYARRIAHHCPPWKWGTTFSGPGESICQNGK